MTRLVSRMFILFVLISNAALSVEPGGAADFAYSKASVKIGGKSYTAHSYELNRESLTELFSGDTTAFQEQKSTIATLPDRFILLQRSATPYPWTVVMERKGNEKSTCVVFPYGEESSIFYTDLIKKLNGAGVKLDDLGINLSDDSNLGAHGKRAFEDKGYRYESVRWRGGVESEDWNAFVDGAFGDCDRVDLQRFPSNAVVDPIDGGKYDGSPEVVPGGEETVAAPVTSVPAIPGQEQATELASSDQQTEIQRLTEQVSSLEKQLSTTKADLSSSQTALAEARRPIHAVDPGDLTAGIIEGMKPIMTGIGGAQSRRLLDYVYIALFLILIALTAFALVLLNKLRKSHKDLPSSMANIKAAIINRLDLGVRVRGGSGPDGSSSLPKHRDSVALESLARESLNVIAWLIDNRRELDAIEQSLNAHHSQRQGDEARAWAKLSTNDPNLAGSFSAGSSNLTGRLDAMWETSRREINFDQPTAQDYTSMQSCIQQGVASLADWSRLIIDLGRRLDTVEREKATIVRKFESAQHRYRTYQGYLLKDMRAAGYLDDQLAEDPSEVFKELKTATEHATKDASDKLGLQCYVRSLVTLRDDLRHYAEQPSSYFDAAGVRFLLEKLEAMPSFRDLYDTRTPKDALQGQWKMLLQPLFRTCLLLDTYWGSEVDSGLRQRLDQARFVCDSILRMHGILPHALELPVDKQWQTQRKAWVNEERSGEVPQVLREDARFREVVLPKAKEGLVFCDVGAWGYDIDQRGGVGKASTLFAAEPDNDWVRDA